MRDRIRIQPELLYLTASRDILRRIDRVLLGTRVPFRNLIDYLEGGYSLEEFLDAFPSVARDQAIAALEGGARGCQRPCAFFSMSNSLPVQGGARVDALVARRVM